MIGRTRFRTIFRQIYIRPLYFEGLDLERIGFHLIYITPIAAKPKEFLTAEFSRKKILAQNNLGAASRAFKTYQVIKKE